jgi:hypothetical protein
VLYILVQHLIILLLQLRTYKGILFHGLQLEVLVLKEQEKGPHLLHKRRLNRVIVPTTAAHRRRGVRPQREGCCTSSNEDRHFFLDEKMKF